MLVDFKIIKNWLSTAEASRLFHVFVEQIAWKEEEIKIYGKLIKVPRLVAWYGDSNAFYSYSNVVHSPLPWLEDLLSLKVKLEQEQNFYSNSVLCNFYRHGKDYMGWHSDNESELGPNPIITSISLGDSRKFSFRHKKTKETYSLQLDSGSLLLMLSNCQTEWQHCLPKTSQQKGPRINLTFRNIQKPK